MGNPGNPNHMISDVFGDVEACLQMVPFSWCFGVRPTLELFQRQHWDNLWETRWNVSWLSWAHSLYTILNRTEWAILFFRHTAGSGSSITALGVHRWNQHQSWRHFPAGVASCCHKVQTWGAQEEVWHCPYSSGLIDLTTSLCLFINSVTINSVISKEPSVLRITGQL